MMYNKKISPHQFKLLVVLCYIGTAILAIPSALASDSRQCAWAAALFGILFGLLLVWAYNSLGNYMGDMTIIEYSEKILGKWIGKIVALLMILFLYVNTATLIFIGGNFITTQMMQETPINVLIIIFVIVIVIGARYGLETFARLGEILFPGVIIIFTMLALLLIKDIEFKNLQPFFEFGIKPTLKGSLLYSSFTSMTLVTLLMIFPAHVNNLEEAKKSFLKGTLIGGIILFVIILLCILVLGADVTARSAYPSYKLAQKINIGNFFERLESFITILWFITVFFKSILYFYGAVFAIGQFFKLEEPKSLTVPLGMILIVISMIIYPNSVYANVWDTTTWISIALTFGIFTPLLLLVVSKIKNKKNNKIKPRKNYKKTLKIKYKNFAKKYIEPIRKIRDS